MVRNNECCNKITALIKKNRNKEYQLVSLQLETSLLLLCYPIILRNQATMWFMPCLELGKFVGKESKMERKLFRVPDVSTCCQIEDTAHFRLLAQQLEHQNELSKRYLCGQLPSINKHLNLFFLIQEFQHDLSFYFSKLMVRHYQHALLYTNLFNYFGYNFIFIF